MKKLANIFASIIALAAFGATIYAGLQTADAQTGGGFPSSPRFQCANIGNGTFPFNCGSSVPLVVSSGAVNGSIVESVAQVSGGKSAFAAFGPSFTDGVEICVALATNGCGTPSVNNDSYLGWVPSTSTMHIGVTNGSDVMTLNTSNGATIGAPTGGGEGVGTLNAINYYINGTALGTGGTVAGTISTGCTTTPAITVRFHQIGKIVTGSIATGVTCTSNVAGSFNIAVTFPAGTAPAQNMGFAMPCIVNGVGDICEGTANSAGTGIFVIPKSGTTFSGVTGTTAGTFTYTQD